jgi:hypothetical protein
MACSMTPVVASPSIATVRELSARYTNWGRWGPDDERGTLNFVSPEHVRSAAGLIHPSGRCPSRFRSTNTGPSAAAVDSTRFISCATMATMQAPTSFDNSAGAIGTRTSGVPTTS